jgi:hypothetical protein
VIFLYLVDTNDYTPNVLDLFSLFFCRIAVSSSKKVSLSNCSYSQQVFSSKDHQLSGHLSLFVRKESVTIIAMGRTG